MDIGQIRKPNQKMVEYFLINAVNSAEIFGLCPTDSALTITEPEKEGDSVFFNKKLSLIYTNPINFSSKLTLSEWILKNRNLIKIFSKQINTMKELRVLNENNIEYILKDNENSILETIIEMFDRSGEKFGFLDDKEPLVYSMFEFEIENEFNIEKEINENKIKDFNLTLLAGDDSFNFFLAQKITRSITDMVNVLANGEDFSDTNYRNIPSDNTELRIVSFVANLVGFLSKEKSILKFLEEYVEANNIDSQVNENSILLAPNAGKIRKKLLSENRVALKDQFDHIIDKINISKKYPFYLIT